MKMLLGQGGARGVGGRRVTPGVTVKNPVGCQVISYWSCFTSRTFPVMYFLQFSHWMPNMAW